MQNPTYTIRPADYEADEPLLREVRFEVFVGEQLVPAEIEMDERDRHCLHFLALDSDRAVGTVRIDPEQAGKIGRLAVLPDFRRQGIGRALMETCHKIARQHGLDAVWCNAQIDAAPFYLRLGYRADGEIFEEAGIAHRRMTKSLVPGD